ncbi:MAG TPA: hypothetical protein VGE77_05640 [Nocardioides sp.]
MSAPSTPPGPDAGEPTEKPRVELDWVKLVAGALAAVSSAFLLSTLGAVGTLAGAALGSVIASISASLYSTSLERSRRKVLEVQVPLRRRPGDTTTMVVDTPAADLAEPEEPVEPADPRSMPTISIPVVSGAPEAVPAGAPESATPAPAREGSLLAAVPWRTVALWAGGLFLAAMLVLTVVETVVGKSAADITGGSDGGSRTSFGQLVGGGSGGSGDTDPDPTPQPTTDGTSGTTGTGEPTSTGTDEPTTATDEPTTSAPTSSATSAPTSSAPAPSAPTTQPGATGTSAP